MQWNPSFLTLIGLWKFAGAVMYVLHETLGKSPLARMAVPI